MSDDTIHLTIGDKRFESERGVILAPESALENQSHILRITTGEGSSGKHTAHALAQMAHVQNDDGELDAEIITAGQIVTVAKGAETHICKNGLAMIWTADGILLFAHEGIPVPRMLKLVLRECTRWIRLDVR